MPPVFTDDFEGYSTGNLNGQGTWSGNTGFQVENSIAHTGSEAVTIAAGSGVTITKVGTAQTDGGQRVWMRLDASAGTAEADFYFQDGGQYRMILEAYNGTVQLDDGTTRTQIGTFSVNTWFSCDVQWRSSDHKFRGRADNGAWSGWLACKNGTFTSIDRLLLGGQGTTGNYYWDDIGPIPTISSMFQVF